VTILIFSAFTGEQVIEEREVEKKHDGEKRKKEMRDEIKNIQNRKFV
jgi:hypothetical protein